MSCRSVAIAFLSSLRLSPSLISRPHIPLRCPRRRTCATLTTPDSPPVPSTPTTPSTPSVPTNAAFIAFIKTKASSNAVRKLVTTLQQVESGEGPWSSNDFAPDATAYNTAIRALIRLQRPDLATTVYSLRVSARLSRPIQLNPDPNLAAAVLRCNLRDAKKRPIRDQAVRTILDDLQQEVTRIPKDALPRDVPRFVAAFADLSLAFLNSVHLRHTDVRAIDIKHARSTFSHLYTLSLSHPTHAALPTSQYNDLIRTWGKARDLGRVFKVLDMMRATDTSLDSTTFEFIANAAVRQVRFVTGAVSMATLPAPLSAEVAFVGRSNVGKSSLVNMLTNRKALAYVSGRPGKTQQLNYFIVNERDEASSFYLVDLPGVGYAKVPQALQDAWTKVMFTYFRQRPSLRLVLHLVDGRHGVQTDDERLMGEMGKLRGAFKYVVVLTKMDKTTKQQRGAGRAVVQGVRQALGRNGCDETVAVVETSSMSKLGRDEMWRHLREALQWDGDKTMRE